MFRICFVALILLEYCFCDPKKCDLISSLLHCGEEVQNIPKASEFGNANILFLDLRNCSKLKFAENDFDGYENLENLELSYIDMPSQRGKVPLDKFSNLSKLSSFAFTDSKLTDSEMWILPKNLNRYNVDSNEYTKLDVSMCPNITRIQANDNKLKNIPKLSDPPPPIEAMYFKNNDMSKLRVEDIAPLCKLRIMKLEIPSNSYLHTEEGACDCMKLQKWFVMFNISGSELNCHELPPKMKCDLTCNYINDLRRNCPYVELPSCLNESLIDNLAINETNMPSSTLASTIPFTFFYTEDAADYEKDPPLTQPYSWNGTIITIVLAGAGFMILMGLALFVYAFTTSYNESSETGADLQEERPEERFSYGEEAEEEI